MAIDANHSANDWFDGARSDSAPRWATFVSHRCRYCGALVHAFKNGRLAALHAGNWNYTCTARPFWTFGRGHKAK